MNPNRVRLDSKGISEILNSGAVASITKGMADQVAASARASDSVQRHAMEVVVDQYTTKGMRSDRTAASVTLKHVLGKPSEGKYGILTSSAGGLGLEVTRRT